MIRKNKLELLMLPLIIVQMISNYLIDNNTYKNLVILITGIFMAILIVRLFFAKNNINKAFMWYIALFCGYVFFFIINIYINRDLSILAQTKQIILYMFFPITLFYFMHYNKWNKDFDKFIYLYGFLNIIFFIMIKICKQENILKISNEFLLPLIIIYPTIIFTLMNTKKNSEKIPSVLLSIFSTYYIINSGNKLLIIIMLIIYIFLFIKYFIRSKEIKADKLNIIFLLTIFILMIGLSAYKFNLLDISGYKSDKNTDYHISNNHYDDLYQLKNNSKFYENISQKSYYTYLFSYDNETFIQKIFGVGKININNKNKIDILEILCCYGLIGCALYFLPIVICLLKMLKYVRENKKKFLSDYNLQVGYISIFVIVILSIFFGNILIAPGINLLCALIISNTYSNISKTSKDSYKFINFKRVLIVILFAVLSLLICRLFVKDNATLKSLGITIDGEYIYLNNSDLKLKKKKKEIVKSEYAVDKLVHYDVVQNGKVLLKIIFVNRKFSDNLTYNYITAKNVSDGSMNIIINTGKYDKYIDLDKYAKEKEYSTTVGYDKTSLPSKYITYKNKYSLDYNTHVYKTLSVDYDTNNHSIIKELIEKVNITEFANQEMGYIFDLDTGEFFDTLTINSKKKMFNNEGEMNKFIEIYNSNLASGWLSFDGSYVKIPYSIEPYKPDGYGRNVGSNLEKGFLGYYFSDDNFFFKSHILLSIHVLNNYLPHYENSVWLTEYTSTWLSKDYGTKAFYVDTRHNDTISGYLRAIANNDNQILSMSEYYAKYLLDEYNKGNYVSFKYGVLAPDYFTNNDISNTHMSLNHQLAIINNLFSTYLLTDREVYKELALTYLETIVNIGEGWIKENNDLYYRINSSCEFDGVDYKELTLDDLITTQDLLKQMDIAPYDMLDKLIYSKIKYLNDINYNINQNLIDKLRKMGYIN